MTRFLVPAASVRGALIRAAYGTGADQIRVLQLLTVSRRPDAVYSVAM